MVDVGYMALVIALVVAGYVAVASFLGAWRRIPELAASGRYGLYTVPALLLVSTMAVVYAFLNHDFSVRYVAENSNLEFEDMLGSFTFYGLIIFKGPGMDGLEITDAANFQLYGAAVSTGPLPLDGGDIRYSKCAIGRSLAAHGIGGAGGGAAVSERMWRQAMN